MAFANRKKPSDEPGNNNHYNKQTNDQHPTLLHAVTV